MHVLLGDFFVLISMVCLKVEKTTPNVLYWILVQKNDAKY